jgi:Family of unknown function (DUF6114)
MGRTAVEERTWSDPGWVPRGKRRFAGKQRPKLALTLVCLSGLAILWMPVSLYWLAFVPGSFAFAGILFGSLVLGCGVVGWLMPQYVRPLGAFAIILSIASIIGALGGLIIGTLLGIAGGSLCIAWGPASPDAAGKEEAAEEEPGGEEGWSARRETAAAWKQWFQ